MFALLSAGFVSGIALLSPNPAEIRGEDAIQIATRFVRDYGVQGEVKVVSCGRLDRKTAQGGYVWHLYMARAPKTEFSVGITTAGSVLWLEQSSDGNHELSKPSAEWKKGALRQANKLLLNLKPRWTVEQPKDDLMSFGEDSLFFPVSVNGKRFVGNLVGYSFRFNGPKFDLLRFQQPERVPSVNVATATVSEADAMKVFRATYPSDPDIGKTGSRQNRFQGKPQLVYFSDWEQPDTARLAWYVKIHSSYNRGIGISGGSFGALVDAVTGKPIKTKYSLS